MDDKTINFYNKNAEKYSKWRSNETEDQAQKIFLKYTKPDGHVLDLGCGTGEKTLWFRNNGLAVTAIDASAKMLKFLKKPENFDDFSTFLKNFGFFPLISRQFFLRSIFFSF